MPPEVQRGLSERVKVSWQILNIYETIVQEANWDQINDLLGHEASAIPIEPKRYLIITA